MALAYLSSSSSSDSSTDEEIEFLGNMNQYFNKPRRPYLLSIRIDHLFKWDEQDFFARFRLSKNTFKIVLEMVQQRVTTVTQRNRAVTAEQQLLLTLRFYASDSFLINVGELFGIHYSTASNIIKKMNIALASLRPRFINMPSNANEISDLQTRFHLKAKFPRCIGAIDCTHVKISSPGGDNAENYRNRKNFFSINVQTISDDQLMIRDIVARWPGSSHDSTIFFNSSIYRRLEANEFGNGLIVGDGGYAVKNYLLTPLLNPLTRAENLYQESQIRTRNVVERSYGVWKRRFPVLSLGIRLDLSKVEAIIVATAVLHNIAILQKEKIPVTTNEIQEQINLVNSVNNN
ncbi:putative nuclease HARBI1, partial [Aphis craccivora]